ncbi:MAG TPA: DNA polymerase III subunit beta [Actinomycetota bacterium]|nr:DNA polymerase III subunit beta [Actinomycetota bacterium]
MKFRCDRDVLADALQTVQRGVATRPGIPALTGVLMRVEGGSLNLSTTDLEVSVEFRVEVRGDEEGDALVPARLVADIVRKLDPALVEFTARGGQATISCAAYEGQIRCLQAEDFPARREPGGTEVLVAAAEFAEAVKQVGRAASKDEARPILTGVLLEANREGLNLVATDSYRLAIREVTAKGAGETRALVPERALTEAGRAAEGDEKGEVRILLEDSQATFAVGALTLTSRLIEGEFPNYRQLTPEGYESHLVVPRAQLLDAVSRVGLLARENSPIRLEFNALGVRLSSSSPDLGGAVEVVEAQYQGEEMTIAFNPGYLMDGLQAATGEKATLEVKDGIKPVVVRGEGSGFLYLVMPVRLPESVRAVP